jgi:hypothetical protein
MISVFRSALLLRIETRLEYAPALLARKFITTIVLIFASLGKTETPSLVLVNALQVLKSSIRSV